MNQINGVEFHEVANIFPMLPEDELEVLAQDIQENGLLNPIWLHPNGSIIDGRNRYKACLKAGIEPEFETWDGEGSLIHFVMGLNLHRRHLTQAQKAFVALKVEPLFAKEAESRRLVARVEKLPHETRSRDQAGQLLGVSGRYVSDAKRIVKAAPEIADMVLDGSVNMPAAKELSNLSKGEREDVLSRIGSEDGRFTLSEIQDVKREINREKRISKIAEISSRNSEIDFKSERFPVIYADPPWRYEHAISDSRKIENQYPTMGLDEICQLPVDDVSADDCILYMWTTAPKLQESFEVIDSWGFTYKTCMIWDKEKIGMGYYVRGQHEIVLIATKGNIPPPKPESRPASIYRESRGLHSSKPSWFYELIEEQYPEFNKLELFCRTPRKGWQVWGNQS